MTALDTTRRPTNHSIGSRPTPITKGTGGRRKGGIAGWFVLAFLVASMLLTIFPFVLAAMNAFKTPADYSAHGPLGIPHSFDLSAVKEFWQSVDFTNKLYNSILISLCVAVIGAALSLLNAYALGIGKVRGRNLILVFFLMATTVPQEALAYPLYYLTKYVGIFDTKLSVIIVFAVLQSAFGTYLMSSVLSTFPPAILEAAKIDGAGHWQILRRIVLPISWPTLAVLMTFFFIWTWNEFFLPLILLVSNENQTVSVAMGNLQGQYTSSPTTIAAAALMGMLPALAFFLLFQRTLMRGTTAGAVK